jgi:hypothetical protein
MAADTISMISLLPSDVKEDLRKFAVPKERYTMEKVVNGSIRATIYFTNGICSFSMEKPTVIFSENNPVSMFCSSNRHYPTILTHDANNKAYFDGYNEANVIVVSEQIYRSIIRDYNKLIKSV